MNRSFAGSLTSIDKTFCHISYHLAPADSLAGVIISDNRVFH